MEKTNALALRQNLGAIVKRLLKSGKPILVERGRQPVAVLITVDDYKKRFVDVEADSERSKIVERISTAKLKLPANLSSLDLIREIRD